MKYLSSNKELYEYLLALAAVLKTRKREDLSDVITFASRHAVGNMSAEFLGESRIALRRVLMEEDGFLTVQERDEISDVLNQLDEAFEKKQ